MAVKLGIGDYLVREQEEFELLLFEKNRGVVPSSVANGLHNESLREGIERPCTVRESISESFKEIKLMQEGKLPKKTWDMYLRERETKREDFTLR